MDDEYCFQESMLNEICLYPSSDKNKDLFTYIFKS